MGRLSENFGSYFMRCLDHEKHSRGLLLASYRLFGFYQRHFPDSKKPKSKQYLANACMKFMVDSLHKEEDTAFVSVFLPCEILYGFHMKPMCAEMFSTYLNGANCEQLFLEKAKEAGISDTYCSYHRVVMGAAVSKLLPANAVIVNTSLACDANNLTFRSLSELQNVPQYYIDVPYVKDDSSIEYVASQFKELISFIEEKTNKTFDQKAFLQAIDRSRKTIANMRLVQTYRKSRYLPSDLTSELYEVLMMHNGLGSIEALEYSELLIEDYLHAKPHTGKKLVWMHTNPFYQKSMQSLLNYQEKASIIATEMAYDVLQDFHEEDPYRFMAKRLVFDPYNGSAQDRIEFSKKVAENLEADGIVVFCHWGCKETCGASALMKRQFEIAGFPTLILNGDGVDRSNSANGQMATRMEAFLEMLEKKEL